MVRTCLEEGGFDLIREGRKVLTQHQDSLSELASSIGEGNRPKRRRERRQKDPKELKQEGLQPSQKEKGLGDDHKEGVSRRPLYPSWKANRFSALHEEGLDQERSDPLSYSEEEMLEEEGEQLDPADNDLKEAAAEYEADRYGGWCPQTIGVPQQPERRRGAGPHLSAPPPCPEAGRSHFIEGNTWSQLAAAFPVFENPITNERILEPVSYSQLKDLVEAVRVYGVTANYTIALLRRLIINAMTPMDWFEVARTCLNHGQFLDFRSIVQDKAQAQYRQNVRDGHPDWTEDMLLGQGPYAVDQTGYPFEVYRQVNTLFYKSWQALPNKGETAGNLTKIVQAPNEPFSDFVARMLETAERVLGDLEIAMPFVQQIIFEQSTKECQRAIVPIKTQSLKAWIKACKKVGGPLTNAGLVAAVLSAARAAKNNKKGCFRCGAKKRGKGPSSPGPKNLRGVSDSGSRTAPAATPQPKRATSGSAGLDLCATSGRVLTQQMGIQVVETDMTGPLDEGTVGIVLGRSSSTMRGLVIYPGVIDPDYTGTIKVLCHVPHGVVSISPGDKIAQLLLLPSLHDNFPAKEIERGDKGLGSTGVDLTCLSITLDQRPMLTLQVKGKRFEGLVDTGADRSIIQRGEWPKQWPTQKSSQTLQGLGYADAPQLSAKKLTWKTDKGQVKKIQPFVVDVPVNLWGRDVQQQLKLTLTNNYSETNSMLPGPMAKCNALADQAARAVALVAADPVELAKDFHRLYHVPANTLRRRYNLPRHVARDIVKACKSCVTFLHPPHVEVNPRGLRPNALWQMDVTHLTEFGKLKYLHVSVDTFSGVIHATPLAGEKVSHVKIHCLEAWAAWGKPLRLKTDNGPAYTSHGFCAFCAQMQVAHTTGLPYNPQGQGIVERANRSIKEMLQKQKGGIAESASPRERLSLALFTLNFLILNDNDQSAADRHMTRDPMDTKDMVMWKDVINNKWYGPDPVITRSRGAVCVFPQSQEVPHWVPTRLTRLVETAEEPPLEKEDPQNEDAIHSSPDAADLPAVSSSANSNPCDS
ncbi:PREDICTED: uncharacterized protein LOC106001575 [Dipodomys ordii]|uniref:RNA-directed DNA polymerase n=1 Tax=Dipodomys ordii TaxID=10020 RepID=A0A1S3GTT7_DIPOR|nr:PREDICTED: uncharacterized protein LOC106001575 [Dipodomys ordii]